ncbi:DUF2845 domain-containing protein [Shewanella sp. A3A]|nr:DUF2845 domain-containing protein [Shewanella ferrihydritica]
MKKKCGAPAVQQDMGYIKVKNQHLKVVRLTYDLGKGHFIYQLDFYDGKLVKIEEGPRS